MRSLVRPFALALMVMVPLSGVTAWGDSGEIQSQSRSLAKPRRARPFSSALGASTGVESTQQEHVEPRVNVTARLIVEPQDFQVAPAANPPTSLLSETQAGIRILQSRALVDQEAGTRGIVSEPTAAIRRQAVLLTANTFAAFTSDVTTKPFQAVDPQRLFGPSPHGGFCCDQVAVYDKQRDLLIWLLQYDEDSKENVLRVAVSQGHDIDRKIWRFYDLNPRTVGGWNNHYFDFSNLTLGKNYLYVTTNLIAIEDQIAIEPIQQSPERGVVIRLPLDQLAKHQALSFRFFSTGGVVELKATEGANITMYWGAHIFPSTGNAIRVYSWPEESNTVTFRDSKVGSWNPVSDEDDDHKIWLGRIDTAISAAWYTSGKLGFAWTAGKDPLHPRPHIRVAILDGAGTVVDNPHLWNPDLTFAYPVAVANPQGMVGISLQYSGAGGIHPSHAVGVLKGSRWNVVSTKQGTHDPAAPNWGDYISIQPDGTGWIATGYTLQRGNSADNVENLIVRFAIP